MSAHLEFRGVSVSVGDRRMLHDVSLSVARGETVVVYGRSGCGKSLLLNVVCGTLQPSSGDILIGGESILEVPPERRGIGMAFQNFALYPHMSAFENIASPLRARALDNEQIVKKIGRIAGMLLIDKVLDHLPAELSNGQKQRTALARALVVEPSVLLLDDPLRNIDAKLRFETRVELPALFEKFSAAVLYVTQDFREAIALGDRIAVLHDGSFVQISSPEAVYRQPATVEIGTLFGEPSMNLLPCTVNGEKGRQIVDIGGSETLLSPAHEIDRSGDFIAGVRPENVHFTEDSGPGMPVTMETVTPLNIRELLLLRCADGREIIASRPLSEGGSGRWPVPGRLHFEADGLLLFDAHSRKLVSPAMSDA